MALRAAEQDRPELVDARAAWRAEPADIEPRRLVFVDESGIDTCTTRAYARAPRGRRAAGEVPYRHWRRPTVLGALALDGAVGAVSIAAATGARVLLAAAHPPARGAGPGVEQVPILALRSRPDASW